MATQKKSIFHATNTVKKMHLRLRPVQALLNGTWGVLHAVDSSSGQRLPSMSEYIPKEEGELKKTYENRLKRTYVTPYLANAIDSATGIIFRVPPVMAQDSRLDDRVKDIIYSDINLEKEDIIEFSIEAQKMAYAEGMAICVGGFFNPSGSESLADQKESGARPYLKLIPAHDLLGYSTDDANRITMIRFREKVKVVDQEEAFYGDSEQERVTVLTPTKWYTFERGEKGEDKSISQGEIRRYDPYTKKQITDRVPVEVLYGRRIGVLNSAPVFEDLAWINIQHTQVNSDLSWSNHFSLVPFLFATLSDSVDPADFNLGTLSSSVQAKLPEGSNIKWIETSGVPQTQGRQFLKDIEDRMAIATMSSDTGSSGTRETATGRAIDANHVSSKLRSHAEAMESFMNRCVELLLSYDQTYDEPSFEFQTNKDFDISINNETLTQLSGDVASGSITLERYLTELKRRGVYSEDFDVQEELKRLGLNAKSTGSNEPKAENNETEQELVQE